MPPEDPGRPTARDQGTGEPPTGSTPRFRGEVERVDERSAPTGETPAARPGPTSGATPATEPTTPRPGPGPGAAPRAAGRRSEPVTDRAHAAPARRRKVRARKVRRIVRHVEPWSVLKISLLFFLAVFAIIAVASALLWSAARSAGVVDDVEGFITSVGGFGNCEPIDGEEPDDTTPTTEATATTSPPDQLDPEGGDTTLAPVEPVEPVDDDEDCPEGQHLVGEFQFEDGRILQAFLLGGIVLVLAGSASLVVLALLFNLISDLTGGLRVTVLEEEPPARARAGSPPPPGRG